MVTFVKAPMRIPLVGDISAIEPFWRKFVPCRAVAMAIDLYTKLFYFYRRNRPLGSSRFYIDTPIGRQWVDSPKDINNDHIRVVFSDFIRAWGNQYFLITDSDAPIGMGLGSGGSFMVSLISLFCDTEKLLTVALNYSKRIDPLVSWHDYILSFYGGFKYIEIDKDGQVTLEDLPNGDRLAEYLLLFKVINEEPATRLRRRLTFLNDQDKVSQYEPYLLDMVSLVPAFVDAVKTFSIRDIGQILQETCQLKIKMKLFQDFMVDLYNIGLGAGATGGQICSYAGNSSGCLLFFAPPDRHRNVIRKLSRTCACLPFGFARTGVMTWTL